MKRRGLEARGAVSLLCAALAGGSGGPPPAYGYVPLRFLSPTLPPSTWQANRIPLTTILDPAGSEDVSGSSDLLAVQAAQQAWNALNASSFSFAPAAISNAAVLNDSDNANSILWDENGSVFPPGDSTLSTTVIRVDVADGAIRDADTVFNGVANTWSTATPTPAGLFDIQTAAVHEMGHAAGLDHPPILSAALYPHLPPGGQAARALSSDDRRGLAFLYPELAGGSGSQALSAGEGDLSQAMGSIAGQVRTLGALPVHGAHLLALDGDGNGVVGALTAPDGSFLLTGLPAGPYQVLGGGLDGPVREADVGLGEADNFSTGYPALFFGGNASPAAVAVSEGAITTGVDLVVNRPDLPEGEPNGTAGQANTVAPGSPCGGAIDPSFDADYFSFSVLAGDIVLLDVRSGGDGDPLDPVLTLYDPSGQIPLISVDDTPGKGLDPRVGRRYASPGTYYARVTHAFSSGGPGHSYTLSVEPCLPETEPNGSAATALSTSFAERRGGLLDSAADLDLYRLTARAGERLHAEVTSSRSGSPLDPKLTLLAPDGSSVLVSASDTFGKDPALAFTFPASPPSASYYLVVEAQAGAGAGAWYCLALDREPLNLTATARAPLGSGATGAPLDTFPRIVDPGSSFDLLLGGYGLPPDASATVSGGGVSLAPTGGLSFTLDPQGRGVKAFSAFVSPDAVAGARILRVQDSAGWEAALPGALVIRPGTMPGEVGAGGAPALRWVGSQMTWTPVPGARNYEIYRGSLSGLVDLNADGVADNYGSPLGCDLFDAVSADPALPPSGDGYFYLVVAANALGRGSLGVASNQLERPLSFLTPACP